MNELSANWKRDNEETIKTKIEMAIRQNRNLDATILFSIKKTSSNLNRSMDVKESNPKLETQLLSYGCLTDS